MAAQKPATSWIPGASDYLGFGVNIFGKYFKPDKKDKFLDQKKLEIGFDICNYFSLVRCRDYKTVPNHHN